jgi:CRP/FNR family cyclic AMP-dependent transcriptional regulator
MSETVPRFVGLCKKPYKDRENNQLGLAWAVYSFSSFFHRRSPDEGILPQRYLLHCYAALPAPRHNGRLEIRAPDALPNCYPEDRNSDDKFERQRVRSMTFDLATYLEEAGVGRRLVHLQPKQAFFSQGSSADAIFYLQIGRAKLSVVSPDGKEATIALLPAGEFIGEESLASVGALHMATASAITTCTALRIDRGEMIRVMHQEHSLSEMYLKFLLSRSIRTQADLVDQLFNSSERRLARILLLMAEFGEQGKPEHLLPPITQETLAEMVGTTRSRVSFFMNRFRKLGFIEYNGRIRVHRSLLNVVLLDRFTGRNPERPSGLATPRLRSKRAKRS